MPKGWHWNPHHFYRALDVLYEYKERLEEDLFRRRQDLFSQEVDIVFFDTTTVSLPPTR